MEGHDWMNVSKKANHKLGKDVKEMKGTRFYLPGALACSLLLFPVLMNRGEAAEKKTDEAAAEKPESAVAESVLPLKNVVLYSSGVGAFVHEGEVEDGKTDIRFRFDEKQLNDLLKSLFVTSSGKVSIDSINYPSKLPLSELLKNARVNVQTPATLAEVLGQLRGCEFTCRLGDGSEFTGRLTGTESRLTPVSDRGSGAAVMEEYASFVSDGGLRRIRLSDLSRIVPKDKRILEDLQKSLAVLAENSQKSARDIRIRLTSEGRQKLRSAYVIESPVWKTSYRLQLSDDPEKKEGFLQGWALVENPTDSPWNAVRLSLISGRPSSFIQDLYSSIYLSRPTVNRENYMALAPVRHAPSALSFSREEEGSAGGVVPAGKMKRARAAMQSNAIMESVSADAVVMMEETQSDGTSSLERKENFSRISSADSSVQSGAAGELYRYDIVKPVTLGSRESAMLELIGENVETEKKSIYNPRLNARCLLNAVELKNTTKLLLPQGPVTVFADDSYGGDASLSDLPSGQKQILSYGIDLEVEPERSSPSWSEGITSKVSLRNGVLSLDEARICTWKYTFRNKSDKSKKIILEHPKIPGAELVSETKPTESTQDLYRFETEVPAGDSASITVEEKQSVVQTFNIANNRNLLSRQFVSRGMELSKEAEAFFSKAAAMNSSIEELRQEISDLENEINNSSQAHSRTRDALRVVSTTEYRNTLTAQLAAIDKKILETTQLKEEKISELRKLEKDLNSYILKTNF